MVAQTNNSRILVVDDEADIVNSIKRGLESRGLIVDAYDDPISALVHYKPSKYALCIIDIKMPKMNGFELYREIRKLDAGVRICFCTAFDQEYREPFHKAFPELDERGFISKPATLSGLILRIENELKNSTHVTETH